MTFRARLLATSLLAVLLPMIALAFFIRREMTGRLTAQYERRVEALVSVIEEDLAEESRKIAGSLAVLRNTIVDDNRFRRAAVDRIPQERRYLLDYGQGAMQLTGLTMLQIQDDGGRIISSGHFRNEYDRMEPELPKLLAEVPGGTAIVQARAPDAPFLALARVESFQMGNRRFTIVAGIKVEQRFLARLAREAGLTVALVYPDGILIQGAGSGGDKSRTEMQPSHGQSTAHEIVRELRVPFIDSSRGELAQSRFRVAHDLAGLNALRSSIDRWFLVAVAAAAVFAVTLIGWISSRISRPLIELADKTSRVDLDRLDIDFSSGRSDEIGSLSRLLGAMTDRLRASAVRLKDAERRATIGELARQVNHDIKNGLTPIRNVFRHLSQLLRDDPGKLPDVMRERQETLDSSISYLEDLASNYARLYPRSERRPCDVSEIVREVAMNLRGADNVDLHVNPGDGIVILGDPVSLRRIIENLARNAVESLESRPGRVAISAETVSEGSDPPRVHISVTDTGRGINEEQREKVFDDFYSTKEDGTGLGLSIVRRLVMDLDGSIRVESKEGKGSRFIIDLPAAGKE